MLNLHPTMLSSFISPAKSNPRKGRRKGRRGRGRARRNNPSPAVRTGIGAAVGSLAGAVVGGIAGFAMAADAIVTDYETGVFDPAFDPGTGSARKVLAAPLLVLAGSVLGGAIGGNVGAPEGRKGAGALGGGLGGLLGPIGAGLGGALAGGLGGDMRDNPSAAGWLGIVALGVAAVGGSYYAYTKYGPTKALPPGTYDPEGPYVDPAQPLAGVVQMGATLSEAPFVVNDVRQPISLTSLAEPVGSMSYNAIHVPELAVANEGPVAGAVFGTVSPGGMVNENTFVTYNAQGQASLPTQIAGKAIGALVTNVSGDFARFVYESWLAELSVAGDDPDADKWDAWIIDILTDAAPGVDWSQGLAPFVYGDAAYTVWVATYLIGVVAGQTAIAKGIIE